MTECLSCKAARASKDLPPVDKTILPIEVTSEGFRNPTVATIVCAHCDGEDVVNNALRLSQERQGE